MKTYPELGAVIGELVEAKAEAYGRSHAKCGLYLRLLWPEGIPPNRYTDAMLLARDFDKSMRIATEPGAFGESPWDDKAGYALLGAQLHRKIEDEPKCPGTANADVERHAKEQPDSAAPSTSARTTTSASERTGAGPLPQPDGYSGTLESAPASTATEAASISAEDLPQPSFQVVVTHLLRLMRAANSYDACARCGHVMKAARLQTTIFGEIFIVCGGHCTRAKLERSPHVSPASEPLILSDETRERLNIPISEALRTPR